MFGSRPKTAAASPPSAAAKARAPVRNRLRPPLCDDASRVSRSRIPQIPNAPRHNANDASVGEAHFAELQAGLENAEDIEGLLGLGLPSFSTGDGIVAFLRDGKTLVVDATALPAGLGPDGTRQA